MLASLRLEQDDYIDCEALLRRAIAAAPADGEAHTTLADALQLQGRLPAAIEAYQAALALGDRRAVVWNNLGLALQARVDFAGAVRCYQSALEEDPDSIEALYNLGLLRFEQDDFLGAIQCYERALQNDPIEADILNNLGNALFCVQRLDEALAMYQLALQQEPGNPVFLSNLALAARAGGDEKLAAEVLARQHRDPQIWVGTGMSLQRRGDREGAIEAFRRALVLQPDEPTARHLLDALLGSRPKHADPGYIEALFDDYAPRFEGHLVSGLSYQIPALMRWLLSDLLGPDARFATHLDLGCGTGLVGAEMREIVDHLVGLDLSGEMLRRCRNRSIYDALHQVEFVSWLEQSEARFELVTAADVVIYTGDLAPLFAALQARMLPGGRMLFSTERIHDAAGDYVLQPTGRFAHSRAYIRRLAARFGFAEEKIGAAEIRRNRLGWEQGDVVLLRRSP